MRSDNGPEFVSRAILEWIARAGIGTALIDPGKYWPNGTDETFNAVRPHSSLNHLTPIEFKKQHHPIPNRAVLQE